MDLRFSKQVEPFFSKYEQKPSEALAWSAAWIAAAMKGTHIKLYSTEGKSPFVDFTLLVNFQNPAQASAITDELVRTLKHFGAKMRVLEGRQQSDWILIDFHDVVIHLFSETARDLYALEDIMASQRYAALELPQEFYLSSSQETWQTPETQSPGSGDFKKYF